MKQSTNGNRGNLIETSRKELLNKKAELLVSLGINSRRLSVAERHSEDDLITMSQDECLHLGLNGVLYGQLHHVEAALNRLDLGEYGTCANCGEAVPSKRLQAIPWATYCLDCQDQAAGGTTQELGGPAMQFDRAATS